MKQYEKEEFQAYLDSEKTTIATIKKTYEDALEQVDEKIRVLSTRTDIENMPTIIHQKKYQEQIKSQLEGILRKLQENQYKTVNDYLNDCYTEGFLRTMYSLQQQDIPFIIPIDQEAVKKAVVLDSKINKGLYANIVDDVASFKKNIASEISRGIASSLSYAEIARNLKNASKVPISNASRIVRTEGHRIQNQAKLDGMNEAKEKGADVVKQWDATLDGKTRDTHRQLDGQIVEVDEDFEVGGRKVSAPGMFGDPAEDCNCRCTVLQRARWALSSGFTKMDNFTKELQTFESPNDYEQFKKDYWSDENIKYMNYVQDMEDKYGTKNFEEVLNSMSDREYNHFQELAEATPIANVKVDDSTDFMSNSFRPKYGKEESVNYDGNIITLKKVTNSQFDMLTEIDSTDRSKVVKLVEKKLEEVQETLPEGFEMPTVAIVDFDKHGFKTDAIGGYDNLTGIMYFNSKYYNENEIKAFLTKNEGMFASTETTSPFRHELGHKFYYDSIERLANSSNISYNDAAHIIDTKIHDFFHEKVKNDPMFIYNNIGGKAAIEYKSFNYTEVVAECSTVNEHNDIAKDLLKLLESGE